MLYSDITLSQRLERTEAQANSDFVETRARIQPESGAEWKNVDGSYAMFDGVGSPLTQTFGLGVFEDATAEQLEQLESFFLERGAEVFHEVSPMADLSILALLSDRGYVPIELTSVMFQELNPGGDQRSQRNPDLIARPIQDDEADTWAAVAAEGWSLDSPELYDFLLSIGAVSTRTKGGRPFIVESEGKPIAAGGFGIYDDVCILSGAATIPSARKIGAQNALLSARLNFAERQGCKLAMMCALPGSQSQKNAQKNGFNIGYTRIKWQLKK